MALRNRLERLENSGAFVPETEASELLQRFREEINAYCSRRTEASKEFYVLHGREPRDGDTLSYAEIVKTTGVDWLDWDIYIDRHEDGRTEPLSEGEEAQRNGYRLKVEGGRIYRTLTDQERRNLERGSWPPLWAPVDGSDWWVSKVCLPSRRWREVEEEALAAALGSHHPPQVPTFEVIVFLEVMDAKHCCRPATDEEIQLAKAGVCV